MSKTVEFYFDFGSPMSYLAYKQMPQLASECNAELVYKPMLLGGVLKATNNMPPAAVPAKGQYLLTQELPRFVKRHQVPFQMNPHFPVNTLAVMRGCFAAREMGVFDQYVEAVFDAMWVKGLNMADEQALRDVLSEAGIDADKLCTLMTDAAIKDQLKSATEEAVGRGCFGAPTMFVGDEMFFGQDRLDFVRESLTQA
jgi:2-hydroxychromene-2-carboxylate isomerase